MNATHSSDIVASYWVLPNRFRAGEYPAHVDRPGAAARLDFLLAAGIDTFLDLTEPDELTPYLPLLEERAAHRGLSVHYQRFPIVDFDLPQPGVMRSVLDAVDTALADGRCIYVHCWGGLGRTGMVVGCYLVRHGRTGHEALEQLKHYWRFASVRRSNPMSPETPAQVQFVLDWHEGRE